MMRLRINGLRVIPSETIDLPGPGQVLLVTGNNRAGKSSICAALSALLTRDPDIMGKTSAAVQEVAVGDGDTAVVALETDDGRVAITWPDRQLEQHGEQPPRASRIATSLDKLGTMKPADVSVSLADSLRANPSRADFLAAIEAEGLSRTQFERLADEGELSGWDHVAEKATEAGRKLKGAWSEVTQETWGDKKVRGWTPGSWTRFGLSADDRKALPETLARCKSALAQARSDADRTNKVLIERAYDRKDLTDRVQAARQAETDLVEARRVVAQRQEEVAKLSIAAAPTCNCPECGAILRIVGETLERDPLEPSTKSQSEAVRLARQAAAGLDGARRRVADLEAMVRAGKVASDKLKELPETDETPAVDTAAAVENARSALHLVEKVARADAILADLATQATIARIAGPNGIRAERMRQLLPIFLERLTRIATAIGLPGLTLTEEMQVVAGQRSYRALCESERWQADAAIALAAASLDPSSMAVLDRADVLDAKHRNRLFGAIKASGAAVVVAMTLSSPTLVPDLAKVGLGRTVWLERGKIQPTITKVAA